MMPGYAVSRVMRSLNTFFEWLEIEPSPRYSPSTYAYAAGKAAKSWMPCPHSLQIGLAILPSCSSERMSGHPTGKPVPHGPYGEVGSLGYSTGTKALLPEGHDHCNC